MYLICELLFCEFKVGYTLCPVLNGLKLFWFSPMSRNKRIGKATNVKTFNIFRNSIFTGEANYSIRLATLCSGDYYLLSSCVYDLAKRLLN